jgi:hypothetical protein
MDPHRSCVVECAGNFSIVKSQPLAQTHTVSFAQEDQQRRQRQADQQEYRRYYVVNPVSHLFFA